MGFVNFAFFIDVFLQKKNVFIVYVKLLVFYCDTLYDEYANKLM